MPVVIHGQKKNGIHCLFACLFERVSRNKDQSRAVKSHQLCLNKYLSNQSEVAVIRISETDPEQADK